MRERMRGEDWVVKAQSMYKATLPRLGDYA
jgi:hypothetical protein